MLIPLRVWLSSLYLGHRSFVKSGGLHKNHQGCKWKWKLLSHVWLVATLWTIQSMDFPGQNTGVGSLSLLQGIFPTQIFNPGCPHCRQILDQLSHQGSPWILEWVAYPFSRGSSQPRNRTGVSFIAGRFFTNWTIINKGVKNSLNHKWNRLDCSDRDGKGQKKNAVSLSCSSCTRGEKAFFSYSSLEWKRVTKIYLTVLLASYGRFSGGESQLKHSLISISKKKSL